MLYNETQPASVTSASLIDPASPPRDLPVDRRSLVTLQPVQACQSGVGGPRTLTLAPGHPHLKSGSHERGEGGHAGHGGDRGRGGGHGGGRGGHGGRGKY